MKDKDGWGERGIFKRLYLPLFVGPHIGFEYTMYMCVFLFLCLCTPHGIFPAAACISDRLLSRCFPLAVFLYLLPEWESLPSRPHLSSRPPKASAFPKLLHTGAPQAPCYTTGNTPQEPLGPSDCGAAALHKRASPREGGGCCLGIQLRTCFT